MTMTTEARAPDNMSPNEREQWLRERGVQIETASDRRKAESILSGSSSEGGDDRRPLTIVEQIRSLTLGGDDGGGDSLEGVRFVHIPQDASRPISTVTLPGRLVEALGPAGDVIPTYVKSFFADGGSIDDALLKEQAAKQNLMGAGAAAELSSMAIANATAEGSVETFPLVRPSSTNRNEGVYIYLDEVGLLKHLPNNVRASALAGRCGYAPAPNFYGDVFVGRVSSQNFLHNVDIRKEDVMDTTREWMVRAPQENVAWQQTLNEVTGRTGESQPDHAGTGGVAVRVQGSGDDAGGAVSYSWLQNEEEVEMTISLSKKAGTGKRADKNMVKVVFQSQKIAVRYDGEDILDVKLYSKLDVDGCTWTLDGDDLVVTCEKASESEIWPRLEL